MTVQHSTHTASAATQQRLPIFDIPHKGVRNALSQLSLLAGQTDYTTPAAVARLYHFGKQVFHVLLHHATDENEVSMRYLEERAPGATTENHDQHDNMEAFQEELEQLLQDMHVQSSEGADVSAMGAVFYQKFSELHSMHLAHMLEEEREIQPLLWQYFTDEELMAQRREIIGKMKPEDLRLMMRFIVPGQNPTERAQLLRGMKAGMPAPAFAFILENIQEVLSPEDFSRLTNSL